MQQRTNKPPTYRSTGAGDCNDSLLSFTTTAAATERRLLAPLTLENN